MTRGLRLRDVRVRYGDREVVRGVDLDVVSGEVVAVLGANGCGKSTTLKAVVGLAPLTAGEVLVDGRPVTAASRNQVAMVFQQVNLVRRSTVLHNVCSGALGRLPLRRSAFPALFDRATRAEAMVCLERVGLADRALDRIDRLSGGQQQRVAIARALCQRASVILADEPTSALDPSAAEQVMDLLAGLAHAEGIAVAAVLHDPDLARAHADRVVGMVAGQVALVEPTPRVTSAAIAALYVGSPQQHAGVAA